MAVGRPERRAERQDRVVASVGESSADAALDLLELVELAWHDCFGELTPPDAVIEDILILGQGQMDKLIRAAHLAVVDWRDLRIAADAERHSEG